MIQASGLAYYTPRQHKQLVAVDELQLESGQFHVFLGPNGAGKSTLLACLCGDLSAQQGDVIVAGQELSKYAPDKLARRRAVLPQTTTLPFAMTVRDIVAFGRDIYRHDALSSYDQAVVDEVMVWLDIAYLGEENYQRLSGGEQHRVQIARTLAQIVAKPDEALDGRILFLDEPTNHLDVRHQYSLMGLLQKLKRRGLTIVCVLHDIALALNNADSLLLLKDGQSIGMFTPDTLIASNALDDAYGLALNAHWSDHYQRYVVMPSKY